MSVIKIQDVVAPKKIVTGFFWQGSSYSTIPVEVPQLWRIETPERQFMRQHKFGQKTKKHDLFGKNLGLVSLWKRKQREKDA